MRDICLDFMEGKRMGFDLAIAALNWSLFMNLAVLCAVRGEGGGIKE